MRRHSHKMSAAHAMASALQWCEPRMAIFIGVAGWNLRKECAEHFPCSGTHLERYAGRMNCVEINSSFHRPHRLKTYQRWAEGTPSGFRFSVKLPKEITHVHRLVGAATELDKFLDEASGLGEKLGALLVQLPPSLAFDETVAELFFRDLRSRAGTRGRLRAAAHHVVFRGGRGPDEGV